MENAVVVRAACAKGEEVLWGHQSMLSTPPELEVKANERD